MYIVHICIIHILPTLIMTLDNIWTFENSKLVYIKRLKEFIKISELFSLIFVLYLFFLVLFVELRPLDMVGSGFFICGGGSGFSLSLNQFSAVLFQSPYLVFFTQHFLQHYKDLIKNTKWLYFILMFYFQMHGYPDVLPPGCRLPPHGPHDLYPRGPETEGEFTYLDTSDDSGRHTGPEPSSPWARVSIQP